MTRITRPLHGRLLVELPFRPDGGNYRLLRDLLGDRTQSTWSPQARAFEVARDHMQVLVQQLPNLLGEPVQVVIHGAAQTKCVAACWRDANPNSKWECECSCAGRFHGTGAAPPVETDSGVYIDTDYTVESYTLQPDE